MEDQLIKFKTAKLTDKKNIKMNNNVIYYDKNGDITLSASNEPSVNLIEAPTQTALNKYLREKYNIHCFIWYNESTKKYRPELPNDYIEYNTYEEALEADLYKGLSLIK